MREKNFFDLVFMNGVFFHISSYKRKLHCLVLKYFYSYINKTTTPASSLIRLVCSLDTFFIADSDEKKNG